MNKIRKAIIPVAGMGTRFLPATKAIPKEMLPIVNKPTIQYIVEEAVNSGIEEILFITSPYKKAIEDHFDKSYELEDRLLKSGKKEKLEEVQKISKLAKFYFLRQGEPMGSGHAIKLAKEFVGNDDFAVLYGDDLMYSSDVPVLKQLINKYEQTDSSIIGCMEIEKNIVDRYGIISFNNDDTIKNIVEKPRIEEAPSNMAGLGRYILKNDIFKYLDKLNKGANGEYQFTDAMKNMMVSYKYHSCKINGIYYDTGSIDGYIRANVEYSLRNENFNNKIREILKNNI